MELIRVFEKLGKNDVGLAGGKGASLGEMTQAGIPVPPGFVILADSFEKFTEENEIKADIDAILEKVNHEDINSIEKASEEIKGIIMSEEIPKDIKKAIIDNFKRLNTKFVAVRSSATSEDSASAAWAGQLESYLNTTSVTLLENVKKCWASLFTPRAIFYRFEKNLNKEKISVAVVVQKMVESEKSGIAFSVHPVTQDYNQIIIEAGFGLGEAIVSGQITPDSYVITKDKMELIENNISEQTRGLYRTSDKGGNEWRDIPVNIGSSQVINDKEIKELSKLIIKIENHYKFPVDVEWAYEAGKFYIVQSRPITTLEKREEERDKKNEKNGKRDKLIFEKSITRDWPLFIVEMLHEGFTKEFERQLGFTYSDVLFDFHTDGLDIYRAPIEHIDKMREFILGELEKNPKFISKCSKKIQIYYNKFLNEIRNIDDLNLSKISNKELLQKIKDFIKAHTELEPIFVINFWFPIQMEKHPLNKKWKDEIDVAIKMRAETEKVGPEGDRIARKLSEEVSKRIFGNINCAKVISLAEAYNFLDNGIMADKDVIEKRKKGFIYGSQGIKYISLELYAEKLNYSIKILNNEKNLPKIEKVLTRDIPLSNIYSWHLGYTKGLAKCLGWSYSDTLFYFHDGVSDTMRPEEEHKTMFKNEFLKRNNSDSKWFSSLCKNYDNLLIELKKFYKKNKNIKNLTNKQLSKIYLNYVDFIEKVMGPFVIMYWIPQWFETENEKKKYKDVIESAMKYRKDTEWVFPEGDKLILIISEIINKKLKLDRQLLKLVSKDELIDYLRKGEKPNPDILKERNKGFVYSKKGIILTSSKDIKEIFNEHGYSYITEEFKQMNEFKGEIAFRGKVSGHVQKILQKDKIKDFISGNVLVASMTTPEYLPAMKKAAAFITDEGGVTCHAAIVARELKKPAIISTKVATSVLNNNDLVEVDADNGVVRILEKAKKNKNEKIDELVLLGIWDTHIREGYYWLSSQASIKLEKITGINVRIISYIKNRLHYQCVFKEDIDKLKELLEKNKTKEDKIKYINGIYDGFYDDAGKLDTYLKGLDKRDSNKLSKEEFIQIINNLKDLWTDITMQIWYAVFLDIWYPSPEENLEIKKIAAKARDYVGHLHEESNKIEDKLFSEICKKYTVEKEVMNYLLPNEIIEFLNGKKINSNEIKERINFSVIGAIDGPYRAYTGKEAIEIYDGFNFPSMGKDIKNELYGIVANKGKVTGCARVIKLNSEFVKFQDGEILVALQTMVHYVPIMKKAKAILTEFGGLTSHAAIVSRELGKPCIVGIPNLISSIKDGDLVEVDANNGVVRILEKAKI